MKYLKIFVDFLRTTEALSDAEMGRLVRAMLQYAQDGTATDLAGAERVLWPVAKCNIDKSADAYQRRVTSAENARCARNQADII